jgi:hypothetical protein
MAAAIHRESGYSPRNKNEKPYDDQLNAYVVSDFNRQCVHDEILEKPIFAYSAADSMATRR